MDNPIAGSQQTENLTLKEFKLELQRTWLSRVIDKVGKNLIESMPKRLREVVQKQGDIKYLCVVFGALQYNFVEDT